MGKEEKKQASNPLGPPVLPLTSVAQALPPSQHPTPSCPALDRLPFPPFSFGPGHMEPISLVTLKSRRCARLPPWRPEAPALLCGPISRHFRPATRSPLRPGPAPTWVSPQPGAGLSGTAGSPYREHPGAGALRGRTKPGAGARARRRPPSFSLIPPTSSTAEVLPGPSDQDVAGPGASPARAKGPRTGHQLSCVPRILPPAAVRTLVRDRTGKCAVLSPAPHGPVDVERGSRTPSLPTLAS